MFPVLVQKPHCQSLVEIPDRCFRVMKCPSPASERERLCAPCGGSTCSAALDHSLRLTISTGKVAFARTRTRDATVDVRPVRMTAAEHQEQRRPIGEVLFEPRCRPDRIVDRDGFDIPESNVADSAVPSR